MTSQTDYININRNSWNNRVEAHLQSEFYDLEGFLKGNSSLKSIELELLDNLQGKSVLHLQCHFGQDTISLARLGARVTGVDLSDKAIAKATELAAETGVEADFICCDIYELPEHLHQQFDIVFTSYGTIGWLPDLGKWGKLISGYLKPGGKLVFVEFHPVVWMFDDTFSKISYSYFNNGPVHESESGTYADRKAPIALETVTWNHSISEVLHSLLENGLSLKTFQEYNYSPYNCFQQTEEFEPGKFRIRHLGNHIPMVYALVATKPELPHPEEQHLW